MFDFFEQKDIPNDAVEKKREYMRRWRQKNRSKVRAIQKRWVSNHPEYYPTQLKHHREWYAKNKDKVGFRTRKRYCELTEEQKDKYKERKNIRYSENKLKKIETILNPPTPQPERHRELIESLRHWGSPIGSQFLHILRS